MTGMSALDGVEEVVGPGSDLEILRLSLSNTAACLGDALAMYNRVVGKDVFTNETEQRLVWNMLLLDGNCSDPSLTGAAKLRRILDDLIEARAALK